MVNNEIIQNVQNAIATSIPEYNKKNPFSKDGSISYKRIVDAFEKTVEIQVKEGTHQ